MTFNLPCSCGNTVWVSSGDAGRCVPCNCGASVEVPSLRQLRALVRDEKGSSRPVARRVRESGYPNGYVVMAVGLFLVFVGTCAITATWILWREANMSGPITDPLPLGFLPMRVMVLPMSPLVLVGNFFVCWGLRRSWSLLCLAMLPMTVVVLAGNFIVGEKLRRSEALPGWCALLGIVGTVVLFIASKRRKR